MPGITIIADPSVSASEAICFVTESARKEFAVIAHAATPHCKTVANKRLPQQNSEPDSVAETVARLHAISIVV